MRPIFLVAVVAAARLPVRAPQLGDDRYIELMKVDKKAEAGQIKFVLLERLGKPFMTGVPENTLRATLAASV